MLCMMLMAAMMGSSLPLQAYAAEKAEWFPNHADIHMRGTDFQNYYEIDYLNAEQGKSESDYVYSIDDGIYLLMIDGGFVPFSDMLLCEDGSVHVPLDVLEQPLGIESLQEDEFGKVLLWKDEIELELNSSKLEMTKMDGKLYVPLRYVAEAFGCDVGYVSDYRMEFCEDTVQGFLPKIRIITVETQKNNEKGYTHEEGLLVLQKLSKEEHAQAVSRMAVSGQEYEDYDPMAVYYTEKDLGRYYIYQLKGFEELPIFFNKYTGDVYGSNPYTGLISITEGFSDISKAV